MKWKLNIQLTGRSSLVMAASRTLIYRLVTGKTGVGKTRLVNALVGQNVPKEGLEMDASKLTPYQTTIDYMDVTVWDSPGIQDGTSNDDNYIQDMKNNIKDIALMIYCVKMDDKRFYEADKKAIQILTEEFGKEVWNHAVVALTFANKVEDPDEGDELQYFQYHVQDWKKQLKDHFRVVNPEVDIPVIPAGNSRKRRLPDRQNWLSDVWSECYQAMKASARQGMYRIAESKTTLYDIVMGVVCAAWSVLVLLDRWLGD